MLLFLDKKSVFILILSVYVFPCSVTNIITSVNMTSFHVECQVSVYGPLCVPNLTYSSYVKKKCEFSILSLRLGPSLCGSGLSVNLKLCENCIRRCFNCYTVILFTFNSTNILSVKRFGGIKKSVT